jgi:hypothetical protein
MPDNREAVSLQECVDDVRKLAEDANGSGMSVIHSRLERFANEMQGLEGPCGKDEMLKLVQALESAAQRAVPTVASDRLESAALYAGKICSSRHRRRRGKGR